MLHSTSVPALRVLTDAMTREQLEAHLDSWVASRGSSHLSNDAVDQYSHLVSPRSIFFRTLPLNANVLDLGAGDGGLSIYKTWPPPIDRPDIKLYALSLEWAERFKEYDGVEIGNFETERLSFGGVKFDAVLCSHFIEHISDLEIVFRFLDDKLAAGARVYFEWPHPHSKVIPPREFFLKRGLPVTTTNFFDDLTHLETWNMQAVVQKIESRGFAIESAGRIHFPFLADRLRDQAKSSNDMSIGTFAVWYKTGWAQYVVWSRP